MKHGQPKLYLSARMMRRGGRRRRFSGCLINSGLRNGNKKLSISFSARHGNSRFLITHDDHTNRATPFCLIFFLPENPNPNSLQKAVRTVSKSEKELKKSNFPERKKLFEIFFHNIGSLNLVAFWDSKLEILEVMNFVKD